MDGRDPRLVAAERARLFGLAPGRPRRLRSAYGALIAFVLGVLALALVPELASAESIVVTNPGNGNGLTLAQAITRANGTAGADTITFASSAASDTFTAPLPTVTDTVTIDGGSGVKLDFTGVSGDALTLNAGNVVLNGLSIFGASGDGINVIGAGNDTFTRLTVNGDGKVGVVLGGTGANTIGGASSVFGNGADGIDLESPGNTVQDSYVGILADGSVDVNRGTAIATGAGVAGSQLLGNRLASGGTTIFFPDASNVASGNTMSFTPPGLAIDVGAAGRTQNSGNAATNFPTISSATVGAGGTTVDGSVNAAPNADGVIAVFEQSQSGGVVTDTPFASTHFNGGGGGGGGGKFHVTTASVPQHGHTLVAFQSSTADGTLASSEASEPFDPFAGQSGGGGGAGSGGGGGSGRTCPFVPAVQSVGFAFSTGEGVNARFVDALYQALLGRRADALALNSFGSLLAGGLATRMQVATEVIGSQERRAAEVERFYQQLLGRSVDSFGLSSGVATIAADGSQALEAEILASGELFDCSGGTNGGWLDQLYHDLLGRPADQAAQTAFAGQLASGTPRSAIVAAVMGSLEFRADEVRDLYTELLGRQPDAAALNLFGAELASVPEETVEAQILGSPELLARIGAPPAFGAAKFLPGGIIVVHLLRPAYLRIAVFHVTPLAGRVAAAAATKLRRVGVARLGHHGKGSVRLRWNRKVGGHRLRRGAYVVLLEATDRRGRLLYQSDPIAFRVRR